MSQGRDENEFGVNVAKSRNRWELKELCWQVWNYGRARKGEGGSSYLCLLWIRERLVEGAELLSPSRVL